MLCFKKKKMVFTGISSFVKTYYFNFHTESILVLFHFGAYTTLAYYTFVYFYHIHRDKNIFTSFIISKNHGFFLIDLINYCNFNAFT